MRKRIAAFLAALSPDCRTSVRLLSGPEASSLSGARRLGLRLHLVLCSFCRRYQSQSARLRDAANSKDLDLPPAALSDEARRRISHGLTHAGSPAEPPHRTGL
jgi:hypothetical protein